MKEIKNYIHLIKTNSAYKQIDEFLNKNNYINILIKKLYTFIQIVLLVLMNFKLKNFFRIEKKFLESS